MDLWTAIVAISILGGIVIEFIKARGQARLRDDRPDAASSAELTVLRERVQVLERALVEPSHRLSREIEELRQPTN